MTVELPAPKPPVPLKPRQALPPPVQSPVPLSHPTETSTWNGAAIAATDAIPRTAKNTAPAISTFEGFILAPFITLLCCLAPWHEQYPCHLTMAVFPSI
jgi:hypothetical protein